MNFNILFMLYGREAVKVFPQTLLLQQFQMNTLLLTDTVGNTVNRKLKCKLYIPDVKPSTC